MKKKPVRKVELSPSEIDAVKASLAFDRADAWARSEPGTPYGTTTPTTAPQPKR